MLRLNQTSLNGGSGQIRWDEETHPVDLNLGTNFDKRP